MTTTTADTHDLENMTLLQLIETYGEECLVGADSQGYLSRWPHRLMTEIKVRIKTAEQDGVDL